MDIVDVYRFDPGSGEAHHALRRTIGGVQRRFNAHALMHGALDFGAGATGNVLSAVSDDDTIGTFIDVDGATMAVFKVEISAVGVSRRLYAVLQDGNGTPLYTVEPVPFEVAAIGVANGPANGSNGNTRVSGYFHAGVIRVPLFGAKQATLWLLDGASSPSLHVWGCGV